MFRYQISLNSIDGVVLEGLITEPDGFPRAAALLVHGITVDLHEGGSFDRLTQSLAENGFYVLQFSFRGHGNSNGRQEGVTIAGELLDFQTALSRIITFKLPISIVAASFGAVSTSLLLERFKDNINNVTFWNPVLDLRHTFIDPHLNWGMVNFGDRARNILETNNFFVVDDDFKFGWVLFDEFSQYNPYEAFVKSNIKSLIIHCELDSYVSYDIAKNASKEKPNTQFVTIKGSDHGFDTVDHMNEAVSVTTKFILENA